MTINNWKFYLSVNHRCSRIIVIFTVYLWVSFINWENISITIFRKIIQVFFRYFNCIILKLRSLLIYLRYFNSIEEKSSSPKTLSEGKFWKFSFKHSLNSKTQNIQLVCYFPSLCICKVKRNIVLFDNFCCFMNNLKENIDFHWK